MSRREKLSGIFAETSRELAAANFADQEREGRVLAGPVRTMGLALDRMDQQARELQEALKSGEKVVELDPALIDSSIVRDRLEGEVLEDDDLVKSIEANGQEVPILVRQHPRFEGRYQVAYGHRRLQAVRLLNRKVRAVVRPLTDDELVIAQGIENTARRDLSYIERAVFASSLEARGFARSVIMQALSTDKTELSKLLSVAKSVPDDLVKAIGAAPATGRRRWLDLAEKLAGERPLKTAREAVRTDRFRSLDSDERFMLVLAAVSQKARPASTLKEWKPKNGATAAKIKDNGKTLSLSLTSQDGFGGYLADRLDELYADWQTQRGLKQE
ncbi:plasmid partitioning protein RepB [Chelativorans sp.]|uniref:plasmid partitioning protein RepB n=1 Tax=Chelativorans sp. TaxID=2203393 RepID=UPI0028120DFB|nr:plasmid partitioning protein RepB [Chelativorans sp.]